MALRLGLQENANWFIEKRLRPKWRTAPPSFLVLGLLLGWGSHLAAEVLYSVADLGVPAYATSINDAGQATGEIYVGTANHAFLYSQGQITDLGTLGGGESYGNGINDKGQVTGRSQLSNNFNIHAFLYTDGQMRDLGALGGSFSGGMASTT